MAAAAGKNESVSFLFFMEVNGLEVGEDFSTVATLFWTGPSSQLTGRFTHLQFYGQPDRRANRHVQL